MEKLADSCGKYLSQLMDGNPNIMVLDGDLADSNGAIHIHTRHPSRFIMSGISEQCMVSMAAGMATEGLVPWVFSFSSFLCYRAYDQIRICVAQCDTNVKLVGSHAGGFTGRNGKTHSSLNDIGIISSLPNITIYSPSSPEETHWAVEKMVNEKGPSYLRLPRESMKSKDELAVPWAWIGKKNPVAIVSTGLATKIAESVKQLINEQLNIEIGLLNIVRIHPVPESLLSELDQLKIAIVIEDHLSTHGLASLLKNHDLSCQIKSFGWNCDYRADSGDYLDILMDSELNPSTIYSQIKEILI